MAGSGAKTPLLSHYIEIHFTNIEARGIRSALSAVAVGVIHGFGVDG